MFGPFVYNNQDFKDSNFAELRLTIDAEMKRLRRKGLGTKHKSRDYHRSRGGQTVGKGRSRRHELAGTPEYHCLHGQPLFRLTEQH